MTVSQQRQKIMAMPADITESYILDMLQELTVIAQKADLTNMATILALSSAAASMNKGSKT
jgi:hypothetical protein